MYVFYRLKQRELFMYSKQMSKIDLHFMISGTMEDELIMVIEISVISIFQT